MHSATIDSKHSTFNALKERVRQASKIKNTTIIIFTNGYHVVENGFVYMHNAWVANFNFGPSHNTFLEMIWKQKDVNQWQT